MQTFQYKNKDDDIVSYNILYHHKQNYELLGRKTIYLFGFKTYRIFGPVYVEKQLCLSALGKSLFHYEHCV